MRKSVEVCGKKIDFEFSVFSLVIYKREFFCEFLDDLHDIVGNRIEWLFPEKASEHSESVLKLLWTLAKTADENIRPFNEFLDGFDEFPVFDIFNEIYEDVIFTSLKYDRRYRVGTNKNGGKTQSTEEIIAVLMNAGLSLEDMKHITVGMGINIMRANADLKKLSHGEKVPDREKQYRVLKAQEKNVEEKYKNGEISKEKYDSFKNVLREWEEG